MASPLEALTRLVSDETIARESQRLQEAPSNVARGFQSALPSILAGLVAKANDHDAMRDLSSMLLTPTGEDPSALHAQGFLSTVFGDRLPAVQGAIADASGVKRSSAAAILGLAAPTVMAFLGRQAQKTGSSMYGLVDQLSAHEGTITAAAPRGLAGALGLSSLSRTGIGGAFAARHAASLGSRRWLPIAALTLAALALFGWLRSRQHETLTTDAARVPSLTTSDLGTLTVRTLPSDVQLRVPERGIESRVIAYIEEGAPTVTETSRFDFDHVSFDTGASTLRPGSEEQIRNVAEILKAYPAVRVEINGYSEESGNAAANAQLAERRAEVVRQRLIAFGLPPGRITAGAGGRRLSLIVVHR